MQFWMLFWCQSLILEEAGWLEFCPYILTSWRATHLRSSFWEQEELHHHFSFFLQDFLTVWYKMAALCFWKLPLDLFVQCMSCMVSVLCGWRSLLSSKMKNLRKFMFKNKLKRQKIDFCLFCFVLYFFDCDVLLLYIDVFRRILW